MDEQYKSMVEALVARLDEQSRKEVLVELLAWGEQRDAENRFSIRTLVIDHFVDRAIEAGKLDLLMPLRGWFHLFKDAFGRVPKVADLVASDFA